MTHTTRHIALALAVTLTGCLPALATPQLDAGGDTGGDVGRDVAADVAADVTPDVAPDTSGCQIVAPLDEWCESNGRCGSLAEPGCGRIECGQRCQPTETCSNEGRCECAVETADVCKQALVACGTIPNVTCGGEPVSCGSCDGFQTCDAGECALSTVVVGENDHYTADLSLGEALGYHQGTLLISSHGVMGVNDSKPRVFEADLASRTTTVLNIGAPPAKVQDLLGISLDIEGDHAIIGSPFEAPEGAQSDLSGVVRVFEFDGTRWVPFDLTAGDNSIMDPGLGATATGTDRFSRRVAVDYPFFAASASNYDSGDENGTTNRRGRVHLWHHSSDGTLALMDPEFLNPGSNETATFMDARYGRALELGGEMLFVGAPRAKDLGGTRDCGLVRIFDLGTFPQKPASVTIRDENCLSTDEALHSRARDSGFGSTIVFDGEHLFIAAPEFPAGLGPGAVFIYDYDSNAPIGGRFVNPTRVSLDAIPSLSAPDNEWSMTRAGDALVIGSNVMGQSIDPATTYTVINEGLIAILREDEGSGTWSFEEFWAPPELAGQTAQFGHAVEGTPDGRVFVSAPNASVTDPNHGVVSNRGIIYELDLGQP